MNQYCYCDYCNHGDMPIDDEMTLEMRLDIAEAALSGIRQHLWKLDHKLTDLSDWAKRTDRQMIDQMKRDLERLRDHD
jgi:hypothetical protein